MTVHNLNVVEKILLQYLEFKPMIPTPIEFVRLLLFFANNTQDFTDIVLQTAG